jgi:hypothetical protein
MKHRIVFGIVLIIAQLCFAVDIPFELTVLEKSLSFAAGCYDVGDIDGDKKNDIIASGNSPRLWWAKHSDPMTRYTISDNVKIGFEIHAFDVDKDGDLDVMTSGDGLTWLEHPGPGGNPASAAWKKHDIQGGGTGSNGGSHDFKIGDINADGKIDAVERNKSSTLIVYIQKSLDSWDRINIELPNTGEGTWLGDIDNDGDLDVTDGWIWLECPGQPSKGTCNPLGSWSKHTVGNAGHKLTRVVIADLNDDKRKDIVCAPAEYGGNKTVWFEAPQDPKNGTWKEHLLISHSDPNFHTVQVGDIDVNGTPDIVLGTTAYHSTPWGRQMLILYNVNGDGSKWEEQKWESPKGVWQGVVGDVASDGDLDILTANYSGGQGEFWENKLCDKGNCATQTRPVSAAQNTEIGSRCNAVIAGNVLTIESRGHNGLDMVQILNMHGRILSSTSFASGAKRRCIDISHMPKGCYCIKISAKGWNSAMLVAHR